MTRQDRFMLRCTMAFVFITAAVVIFMGLGEWIWH